MAALGVAFYHFDLQDAPTGNFFNELTGYGRYGVEAFFFMSGFCIQAAAHRASGVAEFFWQRFWRIYPPFLFSLVVIFGAAVVRKLTVGANDAAQFPTTAADWLTTLAIMIKPATPVKSLNWVYWALSYEVIFYLIVGLLMFTKKWRFPVLFLITGLTFFQKLGHVPGLFFLRQWSVFCLGIAFCEFTRGEKKKGIALMALSFLQVATGFAPVETGIIFLTFITVLISVYWPEGLLCRENLFTKLGRFSYSFYLLHVPIGIFMFVGAQEGLRVGPFPRSFLVYLANAALCLAFAYAAFLLVEKPSMEMGKSFHRVNWWLEQKRKPSLKKTAVVISEGMTQ